MRPSHLPGPRPLWAAFAVTLLVLVSALFAVAPVWDPTTLAAPTAARLAFSPAYLAAAPIFDVLDTLSLLSVAQHVAVLLTAIVTYAAWRVVRRRRRRREPAAPASRRPVLREIAFATLFAFVLVAIYGGGALIPRPMAALETDDLDVVIVDVHSHTMHSHDGRSGWGAEDVRRWHAKAGYHAAYVTDHRTFRGAEEGAANNPEIAAHGTVLLPGLEVVYNGERVNVLSAGRVYRGLTTSNLWDIDTVALSLASLVTGREPIVVQTLPGRLDRMTAASGPGMAGVRAIEIVDGAPRGLTQTRGQRAQIIRVADSLNLALVAGSNNHGWGSTAPGWTLFRINNWRAGTPDQLASAIEAAIRQGGRGSTRVVERRVAEDNGDPLRIALTVPLVSWRMLTTLSTDQRVMWLVWTWAIALATLILRRRRRAS